jgi:hypothetical protein
VGGANLKATFKVYISSEAAMNTAATDLRTHLYTYLDRIAETGEVLEVRRKGVVLRISREPSFSLIGRLPKRATMLVDADAIVNQEWSEAWKGEV